MCYSISAMFMFWGIVSERISTYRFYNTVNIENKILPEKPSQSKDKMMALYNYATSEPDCLSSKNKKKKNHFLHFFHF